MNDIYSQHRNTFNGVTSWILTSMFFLLCSITVMAQRPSARIQFESFTTAINAAAATTSDVGGGDMVSLDDGDTLVFNNVDFGGFTGSINIRLNIATAGVILDFKTDSPTTGTLIATYTPTTTGGSYVTRNFGLSQIHGVHTLYVIARGTNSGEFNWFELERLTTPFATVYTNCSYGGTSWRLGLNDYATVGGPSGGPIYSYSFATQGITDNAVSSEKVRPGCQIALYENAGLSGASLFLGVDSACLSTTSVAAKVSGAKVRIASPSAITTSPNNIVRLRNRLSGKYLTVMDLATVNGASIQQSDNNNATNQRFGLVSIGSGAVRINTYTSTSGSNNANIAALQISGSERTEGAQVVQTNNYGGGNFGVNDHQKFYFLSAGDGYYTIWNQGSSKILDIKDQSTASGNTVELWSEGDITRHSAHWQLVAGQEIDVAQNSTNIDSNGDFDFGDVTTPNNSEITFTISNPISGVGAANLLLSGTPKIVVSGANASDFTVTADPTSPVAGGASTTFKVMFTPSAGGIRSAIITIATNDTDESNFVINLSGTGKLPQTITFDAIANKKFNEPAFTVGATTTSSLPLTFSIVSGPATISGNTVTLDGTLGTVTIKASQAGDGEYNPAEETTTFEVICQPNAPQTTGGSHCGPGTVTVSASGATDGNYRWYTDATGGTAISGEVNSSYTTPSLTSTTPYYVAQFDTYCESERTEVSAQIKSLPATPVVTQKTGELSIILQSSSTTGNQWNKNGTAISGATNQTLSLEQSGSYTVAVTVDGCTSTSTEFVLTSNENSIDNVVNAYPNPVQNKVTVHSLGKKGEVKLYDVTGKVRSTLPLNGSQAEFDLSEFETGFYTIEIISGKNRFYKKIIKAKN
jgi:hypothetical protein